jgi:RNA polymerase sigma factor (sigma-70 family)
MLEQDDNQLLQEFARHSSEAAFATLARRHVNLVYSAALRFTRNPNHAEEISQAVFIILARKAGSLRPGTVISGWLYQTARLAAANFMKGEIRRQRREQEAYMQSVLNEPDAQAWEHIGPQLEEAMGKLGETDRTAVVLRYFENKSAAQVAIAMNLTQETAQRRINRAVEKLRKFFAKRGVKLSAVVIVGSLAANSIQAAPAALGQTIGTVALPRGVAAASVVSLANAVLKWMAWAKAKAAIMTGTVITLVVAGSLTGVVYRHELAHDVTLAGGELNILRHRAGPVDLSDVYKPNSAFDLDARFYAWKTVPRGFQVFDNVPLQIDGIFYLWGEESAVSYHEVFPEQVLGIGLHAKFEALYVYHTTFFTAPKGAPVYSIVFNYRGGSSATNLMRYSDELLNWTPNRNKTYYRPNNPDSKVAWIGGSTKPDNKGDLIRLILTEVRNPHPDLEVETIDLYSCKSRASAAIFAMTTGRADLMK